LSRYYHEVEPGRPRFETVSATVKHVTLPTIFVWLTTVLADATLALNPIPAIREFGIFSVLGITMTFALSLTFIPAALVLLPDPKRLPPHEKGETALERALERIGIYAMRHRRAILAGSVAVCLASLWGASKIELETDYLSFFSPKSTVRRDNAR